MWIMDDSADTRRLSLFQQFSNLPNYFHKKIQIREKEIVLSRHRPSSATEYLIRNKAGTTNPPKKKKKNIADTLQKKKEQSISFAFNNIEK